MRLFHLTQQNIVNELKGYLRDGYYVNMMIKQYRDRDFVHEVVFYGFDGSSRCFTAVEFENEIFESMTFSYSYIEEIIEKVKGTFRSELRRGMMLELGFQYPVTIFKLNPSFNSANCVFEAYRKVKQELNGAFYDLHFAGEFAEYKSQSYGYRYK